MSAHVRPRSLADQFAPALARDGGTWASLGTTARGGALALSLCAHVAVVAAGLHASAKALAAPEARATDASAELAAPELVPLPPDMEPETPPRDADLTPPPSLRGAPAPTRATVARAVPAPENKRDALDAPATTEPAATPSPEPLATTAESAAPRFVLPAVALQASPGGNAPGAPATHAGFETASAPLAEREVDVAARLVAGTPPAYTASAQAAGVEASVPVELVIDATGAVTSAVVLTHVGYGLDEAALAAVRKYRFAPARQGGKVVAVRMRWVVRFELD